MSFGTAQTSTEAAISAEHSLHQEMVLLQQAIFALGIIGDTKERAYHHLIPIDVGQSRCLIVGPTSGRVPDSLCRCVVVISPSLLPTPLFQPSRERDHCVKREKKRKEKKRLNPDVGLSVLPFQQSRQSLFGSPSRGQFKISYEDRIRTDRHLLTDIGS